MGLLDFAGISPSSLNIIWFAAWVFIIFFFCFCLPILLMIWYLSFKVKAVVVRERAGQAIKGFITRGKIKKRKGHIPVLKLRKVGTELPIPPKECLISMGRRDFVLFYEDKAGDPKPFKFFTDRIRMKKVIEYFIKKANVSEIKLKKLGYKTNSDYFISALSRFLVPGLSVDDVDMRNFKVMTDRDSEEIYKKINKWQTIAGVAILGFVVAVSIFGMIMMKTICN